MIAPPAATLRSAETSSLAALSFVRYPEAPALIARTAYWCSACMLSTRMRSFGFSLLTCLMSSTPLFPGIDMSTSSTSNSRSRTIFIVSWPSRASPTTSRSSVAPSSCFRPSRTIV